MFISLIKQVLIKFDWIMTNILSLMVNILSYDKI